MHRFIKPALGSTGLVLALAACGGSGSGGGEAPLGSKENVAHELAVLGSLFITSFDAGPADFATGKALASSPSRAKGWSHGTLPRAAARPAKSRMGSGSRLKTSTSRCSGDGTASHDDGAKIVNYAFYGNVSASTDYDQFVYSNCVETYDSTTLTTNGFSETGETPTAMSGYYYAYDRAGQGSTPLTWRYVEETGNKTTTDITQRALGLIEYRNASNGSSTSYKQLGSFEGQGTIDGEDGSVVIDYGRGNTPITYTETAAGESVDGDYAYSSAGCEGAEINIATLTPIAFGTTYATPVAGKIKLTSDAHSVTITFQSNGSATLQFGNGDSATLTQSEIERADPDNC
ncbi:MULTISPECIES: hypothetical protein [Hydrocarboniphaga]|jgi:hypothetical protein|uniref:Lipoprotein n=1 Tax=Hydrocarboniphaga effusa AP103 TaxID=1172194 RepID=I8HXN7_9GAMM|nr:MULTISPECIES: hypothetical protein [Hydrocarboniphaga]EIT68181.1 hypothetical protein WQQ_46160 [Hydrocarboniphaga effusa AP103]MDZ4078276.1 hypothetical protein [Hydrocarboniphaga sp.]